MNEILGPFDLVILTASLLQPHRAGQVQHVLRERGLDAVSKGGVLGQVREGIGLGLILDEVELGLE